MPLTKDDLQQIKEVVDISISTAIDSAITTRIDPRFDKLESDVEDLAIMSQHQFEAIDNRFNQLEGRLQRAKFQF